MHFLNTYKHNIIIYILFTNHSFAIVSGKNVCGNIDILVYCSEDFVKDCIKIDEREKKLVILWRQKANTVFCPLFRNENINHIVFVRTSARV